MLIGADAFSGTTKSHLNPLARNPQYFELVLSDWTDFDPLHAPIGVRRHHRYQAKAAIVLTKGLGKFTIIGRSHLFFVIIKHHLDHFIKLGPSCEIKSLLIRVEFQWLAKSGLIIVNHLTIRRVRLQWYIPKIGALLDHDVYIIRIEIFTAGKFRSIWLEHLALCDSDIAFNRCIRNLEQILELHTGWHGFSPLFDENMPTEVDAVHMTMSHRADWARSCVPPTSDVRAC